MKHYLLMSASDVVARTMQAFSAPDGKEQGEWAGALLENAGALELMRTRMAHSSTVDIDLISRVLATRCYQVREIHEEDRPKLFFLDFFRSRGLFQPLEQGVSMFITRVRDYQAGEVRFIGDKSDDWPTEGGHSENAKMQRVKNFGKAIEYGIFELWEGARDGKDIVAERTRDALYDIDVFVDYLIANGSPLHGIYGFLGHPDVAVNVVPASAINGPATDWPTKTPEEIIFDLQVMRDSTRVASNYNEIADTLILSDKRYSFINAAQIGTNGDSILARWLANQAASVNGGLSNIVPFVPYDTAAPGSTPMAVAGNFQRPNIEMPLMPAQQLPVEYHGAKWKVGFAGATGGVNIRRQGRFQAWQGI